MIETVKSESKLDNNLSIDEKFNMLFNEIYSLKQQVEDLTASNDSYKSDNEYLREQNDYLSRMLYGVKSEKVSTPPPPSHQMYMTFDGMQTTGTVEKEKETITYTREKKKKTCLNLDKSNLPTENKIIDLKEDEKFCKDCGTQLKFIGKEFVRKELKYVPARAVIVNIYRNVYACPECEEQEFPFIVKPEVPKSAIPHSYASPEALAQVVKDKFVNSMPLYRQEREWRSLGIEISRATMANWVIKVSHSWLKPLVERMKEILLEESHIHSDESDFKVFNEKGKADATKSYMWVLATIKESDRPIRIYNYRPRRNQDAFKALIKDYDGTVISDAYTVYKAMPSIINACCWAHCRRYFFDAGSKNNQVKSTLKEEALEKIGAIFREDGKLEGLSPEEKVEKRNEIIKPLVDDFFSWCRKNQDLFTSKSKMWKAFTYALNNEKALRVFLDDGLVPLTNSLAERAIRNYCIGKKNWLFAANEDGAHANAYSYSIVETAKANDIDLYDYLVYIFENMPSIDIKNKEELDKFLPWNYKKIVELENSSKDS